MNKKRVSWCEIDTGIKLIAGNLSTYKPNVIVTISKGGFIPACYLNQHLKIRRIYSIGMEFYDETNKPKTIPLIYQNLTTDFNPTDVIVLVDDIIDSGESMIAAEQEIIKHKGHKIIRVSMYYKPKSKIKPDIYYEETDNNTWILFPWEFE